MTCGMNIKLQLAIFKKQKIIDYEKDEQGNVVRTILMNEDFDYGCVR